jgi:hypothetical protein
MSMPTTIRRSAVIACAAALALTGCTGGDGDGDKGPKGSGSSDEYTPGPLDEYMARIYGYSLDADDQAMQDAQAEADQQNREVEELVAACMSEQGFDYTPNDLNGGTSYSSDDLDVEWGSMEFAEKYGYGISTDPWGTADQEMPEYVDPNADYMASMSESELEAYSAALWGEPAVDDGSGEPVEYDWTTAGCYGAAQHEVYELGTETPEEFTALEEEINSRWEQVSADPEVAKIDADWAACMADAGIEGMTTMNEAQQALYDEWNGIQGWDDPDYQALMEGWDYEAKPEGPPAPEVDKAASAAFTKKEIAQAVADRGCQDETDYQARQIEIDHKSQQAFVDQHKDELEAWATAATEARGK